MILKPESPMILKTLVIDDEPLAHEVIKTYAKDIKSIEIVGYCSDALESLDVMNKQSIDLLLLDINMPKISGIEFLKAVNNPPMVILTTAYADFALAGYELNVLDYLTKPFSFIRFLKAIQKAEHHNTLLQKHELEINPDSVFIKSNKKTFQVKFEDITYIEGLGDYIKIYTNNAHFITNVSMKRMEELLPKNMFFRIHKSSIVNLKKIVSIEGNMVEVVNKKLVVGNNYRQDFFTIIGKLSV
jgi:DNA-binding LytR/AlgR family response regulator